MNRKDFFRTLFGGAAMAAGLSSANSAQAIQVNPDLLDSSMPTIGINAFKSVDIYAHSREVPNDSGWREYEATGEKTFTFKGVSRFHLDDIRNACLERTPIRIRLPWRDKTFVMVGIVAACGLTDNLVDFTFEVDAENKARLI